MFRNVITVCVALLAITIVIGIFVNVKKIQQSPQAPNLANPASVNCEKKGGTTVIQANGNGAQYGLCEFEDNMSCEEWALFRGDCPIGGVKTTGFDTIEQKYCAWVGGQTLAIESAQCNLPNGITCSDKELFYNGTCN